MEQLKENRVPGDQGLVLKSRAKHHAIAAMLTKPFVFKDEPLVVQCVLLCFFSLLQQVVRVQARVQQCAKQSDCRYEVNFQDGIDCGGAYIKLLSDSGSLSLVGDVHLTPLKRHLVDL